MRQPWAWLVLHGGRDIDNRSFKVNFRGRILIHTGTRPDQAAMQKYMHILPSNLPKGGIVGSVDVTDCVTYSDSEWFTGPYGLVLKNPKACPLKKVKGKVGIYKTEVDL